MRNTKLFLTLLALFLLLSMVLTACGGGLETDTDGETSGEGASDENVSDGGSEPVTDSNLDENGYLKDNLPALDFDQTVTILCWNAENPEFEGKMLNADAIDSAIYKRNRTTESRLGVTLQYEQEPISDYFTIVERSAQGGYYWDVMATKTQTASQLLVGQYYTPLNGIENSYLDTTQPWWSQQMVEKIRINDNLYFITGDISTNLIQMVYCVYFNDTMLKSIDGLESPYELVDHNRWTINKMMEMCREAYIDIDSDGIISDGDTFGLMCFYYDAPALLHGCGVPVTERDRLTGKVVVSSQFKGQKTDDILSYIGGQLGLCGKVGSGDSANRPVFANSFYEGRSLFTIVESGRGMRSYKNVDFTPGCVPCPKYTSDQETYYSTVRQPITMYGVMKALPTERRSMATATMECLGSEAYRTTTPVIFDSTMQSMNATSPEMAKMLELIRDTAFFDFGRICAASLNAICDWPGWSIKESAKNGNWSVYVEQRIPAVEIILETFFDDL